MKCLPTIDFPEQWHLAYIPNHWCNEDTMVDYLEKIFLPYVKSKREELGLNATYPALAIFDEFNGQTTDAVFSLLEKNHIYYVFVPDRLQPLDISGKGISTCLFPVMVCRNDCITGRRSPKPVSACGT